MSLAATLSATRTSEDAMLARSPGGVPSFTSASKRVVKKRRWLNTFSASTLMDCTHCTTSMG